MCSNVGSLLVGSFVGSDVGRAVGFAFGAEVLGSSAGTSSLVCIEVGSNVGCSVSTVILYSDKVNCFNTIVFLCC